MTDKEKQEKEEKLEADLKKLRAFMREGEVKFTFMKKDGSKRKARGTLKKSLIPDKFVGDDRRKPSDLVFNYFDLDKEDWRCFRKENFVGIDK